MVAEKTKKYEEMLKIAQRILEDRIKVNPSVQRETMRQEDDEEDDQKYQEDDDAFNSTDRVLL